MIFVNPMIENNVLINYWRRMNHEGNCLVIMFDYNDEDTMINYINNQEIIMDKYLVGNA